MPRTTLARAGLAGVSAAALVLASGTGVALAQDDPPGASAASEPDEFTSMITAIGDPDAVVDEDGEFIGGEPGASAVSNFRINSDEEIVCYDITLEGVTPPYESPALTATHFHEGEPGVQGPPRVVFEDPTENDDGTLTSEGCIQGPFTTGTEDDDGVDDGEGFSLSQIENNPEAFYFDAHTEEFEPGAVRGQLQAVPEEGVETGGGGAADGMSATTLTAFAAAGGLALAGGLFFALRTRLVGLFR